MRILRFLVTALLLCVGSRLAQAYPQWQFSSGTSRCNQCHFAPAGTGLINGYGRDAAGDDLSTFKGDGSFMHGAVELPKWLALGLDARGAFLREYAGNPDGTLTAVFPMQLDAYARAQVDAFSASVTLGYRGQARSGPGPVGDDAYMPISGSEVISREHYLMWRPSPIGWYIRAGRFFAPYGLRLVEHTTYIRRDVGDNLLQETYGINAGIVESEWELHLTGFVPDFLRQFGGRETGAAGLYERRFADMAAIGLQARYGQTKDYNRYGGGAYGKAYIAAIKTLFMAEGDVFHWVPGSGTQTNQLVGYFGPTVFPIKGLWLSAYGEINQNDLSVKATSTTAIDGQINWFPYPHFEFVVYGRIQAPQGQSQAQELMVQLHYYL